VSGVLALSIGDAGAQTGPAPLSLRLSQELSRQDNIFRASPGFTTADMVSTTGLQGALDQALGRQHYTASLGVDAVRFRDSTQLSNTAYNGAGKLEWSSENRLSGELGGQVSARRNVDGIDGGLPSDTLNIEKTRQVFSRARLGSSTPLTFGLGAEALKRDFSDPNFDAQGVRQWTVDGSARYQPGPDLGMSLSLQRTQGRYPRFSPVLGADDFHALQADLSTEWSPSGASQLSASLGRSRETHALQPDRSGWNGNVRWLWKPTYHLNFNFNLRRDHSAGQESASSLLNNLSSQSVNTGLDGSVQWLLSAKTDLSLALQRSRRVFDEALVQSTLSSGVDHTRNATLTLHYAATRNLDFHCSLSSEQRSTDAGLAAALSRPYSAKTASCNGQFWLR
jgi:hypothetical protein